MSGRVSRQEFASLADELEDLRQQLAVLRVDKEQLESRVAELEDEAAQRSYSVISECSSAVPVLPIQEDLPADRIEIAHRIGAWLRRCLDGRARGLSGRESLKQASSLYLVGTLKGTFLILQKCVILGRGQSHWFPTRVIWVSLFSLASPQKLKVRLWLRQLACVCQLPLASRNGI